LHKEFIFRYWMIMFKAMHKETCTKFEKCRPSAAIFFPFPSLFLSFSLLILSSLINYKSLNSISFARLIHTSAFHIYFYHPFLSVECCLEADGRKCQRTASTFLMRIIRDLTEHLTGGDTYLAKLKRASHFGDTSVSTFR